MSIFDNVNRATITNAHGEVNFLKIESGSVNINGLEEVKPDDQGFIVGHSESGHHHVLEREGVKMYRGTEAGMAVLYAILENPVALKQDAGDPHAKQTVEPGEYIITNNVEYDPFTEQARRVAD